MGSQIFFWIPAVIAFFFCLFILADYFQYRIKNSSLLLMVFILILAKFLTYAAINFTQVDWIKDGDMLKINDSLKPLYNFKFFIFQYCETMFMIALAYYFMLVRKQVDGKGTSGLVVSMVLQYFLATALAALVITTSLLSDDKVMYITSNMIVEWLKSGNGRFIFIVWKLILIIVAWAAIGSVYGFVANILKNIAAFKGRLFTVLVIAIIFNVIGIFVPIYAYPFWFSIDVLAVVFLALFAFSNHTIYVASIQDQVELLNKEKDLIVSLMKEISLIIGSGEFDLDTAIRKIVADSIKGTNARGGAALLKDPITNRLIVKHVEGLYPPTQAFKTTQGVALTESMIVNKFKAEKIFIGEGLLGQVVKDGEPIYIPDVSKDNRFAQTIQEHMTVTSFIAVPLKTKDDIFGVLSIVDDAKMFLENDLRLLETLGEQAAITINQMQLYQEILEKKEAEKEIGVAGEIQSSLIPHTFPEADKFSIYGFSIPAKGVGGDYYDYIDFGHNKIGLAMFDVSGKGVPASLIMVMIRSVLRTIASLNEDTKDVLYKLNNTVAAEIVEDRYATGFYLLFDAEKGIMSYTNAGHGPLILYRSAKDDFEFLDTDGMPVGIMSGVDYGQNYTIVEKNDIAILYTDGITETMNAAHEEFGLERLKDIVRKNKRENARDIANKILESITRFASGAPQHDDETLLVLKSK